MIDERITRILQLSEQGVGQKPAVADREREFASVCADVFSDPPTQPEELANYGFGLRETVVAVLPYCVSACSKQSSVRLLDEPKISDLMAKIKAYPILAGSAVFLGVDHALCEDVDLVHYVTVGTTRVERVAVATEIRRLVEGLNPNTFLVSHNNSGDIMPAPWRSAEGRKRIRGLLDQLVGDDPKNPDPENIASIGWIQLAWSPNSSGLKKPITLQLHFVHRSFADKDVHPYQELHECDANDFVHTNKPWLAPSFRHYFSFLARAITPQLVSEDVVKAAKRAAVFLGLVGDVDAQGRLVALLDGYSMLDDDGKRQSRESMEGMIGELREEVSGLSRLAEVK